MEWICKECTSYNDGSDQRCTVCGALRPEEVRCVCPECKSSQMAFPGMRCEKCDWLFEETDFAPRRGDDTVLSGYIPGDDDAEEKKNKNNIRVSERIMRDPPDVTDDPSVGESGSVQKTPVVVIVIQLLLIAAMASPALVIRLTNGIVVSLRVVCIAEFVISAALAVIAKRFGPVKEKKGEASSGKKTHAGTVISCFCVIAAAAAPLILILYSIWLFSLMELVFGSAIVVMVKYYDSDRKKDGKTKTEKRALFGVIVMWILLIAAVVWLGVGIWDSANFFSEVF